MLRLLRDEMVPGEPAWQRAVGVVLAVALLAGFAYAIWAYWTPAHPGVDQNGYLVGGKMLAENFTTEFRPREPYEFIGGMWIRTDDGAYHPKYPIGLPLLNALALWLDPAAGDPNGRVWALLISPICTVLSLAATFLLVRLVAGSFGGLLGLILLATSVITLVGANNPWSHGPALAFVTWGMFLLVRWWQTGTVWRGVVAGLLLGYAVTIRYSEGLLLAPLALVAIAMIRWREPRSCVRAATPVFAWAVPVVLLVAYNWIFLGAITGYDTTNESTGFTWAHFNAKWPIMVQQIYDYGLFFAAPLVVVGGVFIFRASWRVGLMLVLWIVPGLLLYAAYYWGGNVGGAGVGFLRFFQTLLPAMVVLAVFGLRWIGRGSPVAGPLAAGIVVALAAGMSLKNAIPMLGREQANNLNLVATVDEITRAAPAGSVLFAMAEQRGPTQVLNFLQWKGDYELYSADAFARRGVERLRGRPGAPGRPDAPARPDGPGRGGADGEQGEADDLPTPLQPARRKYLEEQVYAGKSDEDLLHEQHRIMREALQSGGRRVFILMPDTWAASVRSRQFRGADQFELREVARWEERARPPELNGPPVQPGMPVPPGPPPQRRALPRQPQQWQLVEVTLR